MADGSEHENSQNDRDERVTDSSSSSDRDFEEDISHENIQPKVAKPRSPKNLTLKKKKGEKSKDLNKKRKRFWTLTRFKTRLPGRSKKGTEHGLPENHVPPEATACVCTGYRRTEDHMLGPGIVFGASASGHGACRNNGQQMPLRRLPATARDLQMFIPPPTHAPMIDLSKFNPDDYPTEDPDEVMRAQRARDMEQGIEVNLPPPVLPPLPCMGAVGGASDIMSMSILSSAFQNHCTLSTNYPLLGGFGGGDRSSPSPSPSSSSGAVGGITYTTESHYSEYGSLTPQGTYIPRTVHTQVDYIHCLVPDLQKITNCSFYWGVMDRYEAERLLDNKQEGTFLLRDSAQEEFLFSVSFRRYGRSLHARIEQWNHKFSFDSHDPGVFASDTVCGLIEHYKDPSCCMFFEPMLTLPLNRTFPFSLQHFCRSTICSRSTYDGIDLLPLPKPLKEYLKYYHYKQKVRVRRFEVQP